MKVEFINRRNNVKKNVFNLLILLNTEVFTFTTLYRRNYIKHFFSYVKNYCQLFARWRIHSPN